MGKTTQQHLTIQMDPDLPLHNYNGVLGGVTQTGEIEMNFFADCDALPHPAEYLFTESGELVANEQDGQQNKMPERHVLRTIYARTLLTVDQARNLVSWLMKELDHLDETGPRPGAPEMAAENGSDKGSGNRG